MKLRFILIPILCLLMIGPLFGQEDSEHQYFAKSIFIAKIYPHKLGYRVVYLKPSFATGTIYVPIKWFYGAKNKAELVYGDHRSYPYMDVYWDKGVFSHIRIYVQRDINHQSWGNLATPSDFDNNFSVDTLEFSW